MFTAAGKVLFVTTNEKWKKLYEREVQSSRIENVEVLTSAASTVARLVNLYVRDTLPIAIFSDGMNGGWRAVAQAARPDQIPTFVISDNPSKQLDIESEGAAFIDKRVLESGFIAVALANRESLVQRVG